MSVQRSPCAPPLQDRVSLTHVGSQPGPLETSREISEPPNERLSQGLGAPPLPFKGRVADKPVLDPLLAIQDQGLDFQPTQNLQ